MTKLQGYREYYNYTVWGNKTQTYKIKYLILHALGFKPCYKKGKLGSYCPCYWNATK